MVKGSKHSKSTVLKMRMAKLGKPSNRRGMKASDETKSLISFMALGRGHSDKTRKLMSKLANKRVESPEWRRKVSEGTKKAYRRPQVIKNRADSALRQGHGNHWSGGVTFKRNGYKLLYKPTHPNSGSKGYIMEHRFFMSEHLGRPLLADEVVHHIDHDITNNHISNLQLFESKSAHRKHHVSHQRYTY